MPDLVGFSHLDLTVTDYHRTAAWWGQVLGFKVVTHNDEETFNLLSLMHPSGLSINVMTHRDTPDEQFDETRVGLDHFSMHVADRAELERWVEHLDACGVPNTGIIEAEWGCTVVLRDPDNIQLELFVHPSPEEIAERLANQPEHRTGRPPTPFMAEDKRLV